MTRFRSTILTILAAFALLAADKPDPAKTMLEAARKKEVVDGDLNAAIQQYKNIVSKYATQRAVVADALVAMAGCYLKLGDAQASKIYEQVVRDYPDQKDAAASARARLGGGIVGGGPARREFPEFGKLSVHTVSPDGRFVSRTGTDDKTLLVRDLVTNTDRTVTHVPSGEIQTSVWSPDGKQLAFLVAIYNKGQEDQYEIHVVNLDGTGSRTLLHLSTEYWLAPAGFTPDGKRVLCYQYQKDQDRIFWVDATNSTEQTVVIYPTAKNQDRIALSPDGRYVAFGGVKGSGGQDEIHLIANDGTGETVLSSNASDRFPAGWTPDGKGVLVVSNRSLTSGLYSFPVENGKPNGASTLLQRDLNPGGNPRIESIGMTRNGAFFYYARVFTSDVYTASMDPRTGRVTSPPVPLPTSRSGFNVVPKWSPDSRSLLFYWAPQSPSSATVRDLFTLRFDTGAEQPVPVPEFHGGDYCFLNDNSMMSAYGVTQTRYVKINLGTGEVAPLFESKINLGRSSCTSDGRVVAYVDNPAKAIKVRNIQTGSETLISPFPGVGWSPELSRDGKQVAFVGLRDPEGTALYVAPAAGGPPRELLRLKPPAAFQGQFGPSWSPDNRYIYYVKRADFQAPDELFRVSASGGPEESMGLKQADLRDIDIAPDGAHIAFSIGATNKPEFFALENFLPPKK